MRVFDWNAFEAGSRDPGRPLELLDETLRDGLQSQSVRHPAREEKLSLHHLMDELGVATANVGYPGASPRAKRDATALCREIARSRLAITAKCAGRTCAEDVVPVVEVAQSGGVPLEIGMFLGASPIRRYAEGWEWDRVLHMTEHWVGFARRQGLRVLFVTEDTTRSRPEDLARLYQTAVRAGAQRVCLADTVGCATPSGVAALGRFARASLDAAGGLEVALDWHGHDDRGLAVANALEAARTGADRLHGTALGVGERVGNAAMEQLLINSARLGWTTPNLARLPAYLQLAASALNVRVARRRLAAFREAPGAEAGPLGFLESAGGPPVG